VRAKYLAAALVAVLVGTGCGSQVQSPRPADTSRPGDATPPPAPSGAAGSPGVGPAPSSGPAGDMGVPADIAADVDSLLAATTFEAAMAATRTILERSGVVITEDPTTATPTAAGLYLSDLELRHIADEGRDAARMGRLSFADFASTFGGAAMLPPNDALLAQSGSLDFGVPASTPGPDPNATPAPVRTPAPGETPPPRTGANADLTAMPRHMATFLTGWVTLAAAQRTTSAEPELQALTAPPLYLQALAARQVDPVDLRAPFDPNALRLGALQLTLLAAGMRATLSYAQADPAIAGRSPDLVLASARQPIGATEAASQATFSDCDQLKRLLDAQVPIGTIFGLAGKDFIKDMVKGFITGLFGAGTAVVQFVSPAFTALGLLFKVAALVLLYEHARATVTLEPSFMHKPEGQNGLGTARVKAGIPDAEWERAKQERANDFWSTAIRTCARLLGIPVTSDTIDVAESIKNWVVRWEVTKGLGTHVLLPISEVVGAGVVSSRLERPLQRIDDHSGGDILQMDMLPERLADHPGTEYTDPVTVCAHVVPRHPPGFFKTFLSAGFAGRSLASGGALSVSSLAGLLGELLTAFYREVSTIDSCESMSVSYHVPGPAEWRGRITVEYFSRTEETSSSVETEGWGSGPYGEPAMGLSNKKRSTQVTETFYVGGTEEAGEAKGYVSIAGRSATQGFLNVFDYQWSEGYTSACHYQREYIEDGGGAWNLSSDARGSILLYGDGKYEIGVNGAFRPDEILLPSTQTEEIVNLGSDRCTPHPQSTELPLFVSEPTARGDRITGQLDPTNPGTRLAGSQTTVWDEHSYSVITWDLNHEGPIRLPQF
jgi:hypothetical protein